MDEAERRILLRAAATEELVARYERAARVLRSLIAGAARRGALGTASQRRRQLAAVERALSDLSSSTRGLAAVSIAGGYQAGAVSADLSARDALPAEVVQPLLEPAFAGGANRGTVRALQLSTERKLDGALTQVGRSVEDVFRRIALEEVGTGAAAGLARRETSARIADRLAGEGMAAFVDKAGRRWKLDTYSRMVARTTQREAASLGVADRMGQVGLDLVKISEHRGSCDICKPFEGKVFSLTGRTRGYKKLERPPPFHPNFVVAGSRIAAVGRFQAATRARYSGPVVVLETSRGVNLSIGPNHPVLTLRGWVPAKMICQGDHVLSRVLQGTSSVEDLDNPPPLVKEVWESLFAAGERLTGLRCVPEQFHGDGNFVQGEVDVVGANGFLRYVGAVSAIQQVRESALSLGHSPSAFDTQCALFFLGQGDGFASPASMRVLERPAQNNALCEEGLAHGSGINAEVARDAAHRLAVLVAGLDGVGHFGSIGPDLDPGLYEIPPKRDLSDLALTGKLANRLAGFVAPDCVVRVEERMYQGWVYDFQTTHGTYLNNGVHLSNCEHVMGAAAENLELALEALAVAV